MKKPNPRQVYGIIVLLTVLITPFLPLVPTAKSQASTIVYVDPPSTTGLLPGDIFAVNIMISGAVDLKSWQFKMSFQGVIDGVLMVTDVIEGDFLMIGGTTYFTKNINNDAGWVQAAASILGQVGGVYGDGWLATVIFKVVGGGESPLDLHDTILLDSNSAAIPHDVTDGSYVGAAPYASFSYRPYEVIDGYEPAANQTVTLNATDSYDPEGTIIADYAWNITTADLAEVIAAFSTTDKISTHSFTKEGLYLVKLNVTDSDSPNPHWDATNKTINIVRRDINVTKVEVVPIGEIIPGTLISINVTVQNIGTGQEDFGVTTFYNGVPISTTQIIGLSPKTPGTPYLQYTKSTVHTWDTTGIPEAVYAIKGVAITDPGENNITNNELVGGSVTIASASRLIYNIPVFGRTFTVGIRTDSLASADANEMFVHGEKKLTFNVTGQQGILRFSNVTLPHDLLNASSPTAWIVKLNGSNTNYMAIFNSTHYFIYLNYTFASAYTVSIIGESVADPPQPILIITPTRGVAGQPVTLDASSSTDPDGHGFTEFFYWAYRVSAQGDKINFWNKTTTDDSVTVVFNQSALSLNSLRVTLTITDSWGMENTTQEQILDVLWPFDIALVDIDVSKDSINIGEAIFINVTVTSVLDTHGDKVLFKVTIYGNDTTLTTKLVKPNIQPPEIQVPEVGINARADFEWNTTSLAIGTYTLKATVTVVEYSTIRTNLPAEINITDNMLTYGEVTIKKWGSLVTMVLSPSTINIGQDTKISGAVTRSATSLTDVPVTVQYRGSGQTGAWTDAATVNTNVQGQYQYTWKPLLAGNYDIRASWAGDSITSANVSTTRALVVRQAISEITIEVTARSATAGSTITISGTITPYAPAVSVTINVRKDGGTWTTLVTVTTDAQGNYQYGWKPGEAGSYELQATWEGNVNAGASESDIKTVSVSADGLQSIYIYIAVGAIILIAVVAAVFFLRKRK
ncbi:MAG TPA: PKD domain-containing protein [Candidatus Bathyarchaeia archaeon]|nr:PKD domain-containing protein [Candidatus Bathyarchaeia archaeon]